ncbi:MAG: HAMP domain-containing histidine kinase [Ignavibacteriales bacterium]|nr:HAMP domain-containing histidine kinase [Ignavibacteriales bacterium]
MQSSIKKIGLIVILILVLPLSTFFIYQFASLNEYEKEINKIYLQQLETIIYSVNQYSEDVVSSWVNDVVLQLKQEKSKSHQNPIISQYQNVVSSIFLADKNISDINIYYNESQESLVSNELIRNELEIRKPLIDKLQKFLESGYQRIEPIGKITSGNKYLCLFPLNKNEVNWDLGGIIFDPARYIQQSLASKISQAAGNEFILTVSSNENNLIFSTDVTDSTEIVINKPLWLIPGYTLGIKLKSGSIQELVSQRFYTNLIVLALLLFVLIVGLILIYYNLRKEIRLAQLKSDFIANVSHELRTPLTMISMYSETLALNRLKSEEKKREYYSVIHNETNRLSKIVNSILNFSKMEQQTRKFNYENCSLIEINDDVFKTYEYHIKSKGFSYSLNQNEKVKDIIADIDAVSESIINLIDNAIKYCNEKKEFAININENEIGPFWEIKDFGIGISASDQKKIFDKFYRVSSGLVNTKKGTGLGLSLVKQIMKEHSGNVIVESKIGEGSTFRLQFNNNFNGKV